MTSRRSASQRKLFDPSAPLLIHDDDDDPEQFIPLSSSPAAKRRKQSPSDENDVATTNTVPTTPARPTTTATNATIVTPPDLKIASKEQTESISPYVVPKYIHKNVEYDRKDQRPRDQIPKTVLKAFNWISEHCDIPADLEQNRKYGPLSGSCYEERTVRAYRLGQISGRHHNTPQLCTSCAETGHAYDECPSLV